MAKVNFAESKSESDFKTYGVSGEGLAHPSVLSNCPLPKKNKLSLIFMKREALKVRDRQIGRLGYSPPKETRS